MAVATKHDVQISLQRELSLVEHEYVDELLDRVERKIAGHPQVNIARADADDHYARRLADIEAEAVARVFRAEGSVFISESEGDYSYRRNLQVASGYLDILDHEWAALGVSDYGTVSTVADYARTTSAWRHPEVWYPCDW